MKHVPRTKEFIPSTDGLEFIKMSGGQEVYNCPWCETKYGPNSTGKYPKLYIDPNKGVGICYRCNTVVVVGDPNDPKKKVKRILSEREEEILEPVLLPEVHPVKKTLHRILNRSPYIETLGISNLAILETPIGTETYPLFPFLLDSIPYSYQIWLGKTPKYYTFPGPKVFYSPTGLKLDDRLEELTIVEGVFDALGALYLGYPNPIAVLGNTLSKRQKHLLEVIGSKKVKIFLDDTQLSTLLALQIAEQLGLNVSIVESDGEDPDEKAVRVWRSNR